jgi:hypothetical protein
MNSIVPMRVSDFRAPSVWTICEWVFFQPSDAIGCKATTEKVSISPNTCVIQTMMMMQNKMVCIQ